MKTRGIAYLVAPGLVSIVLHVVTVTAVLLYCIGMREQAAMERQDLPCTYLAHHEPESVTIVSNVDCHYCHCD